jgi:ketosteroid isomerase-like protein
MTTSINKITRAIAVLLLLIPVALRAQSIDPDTEKNAIDKLMHEYFEAYSRGDMAAVIKLTSVPFVIPAPQGYLAFTTADEVSDWFNRVRDAAVKQGYAKTEWIDFGVRLLGPTHAIAGGTYVRYKVDGSELNRSGGTYLLSKTDGGWKIGVNLAYPAKDAFRLE